MSGSISINYSDDIPPYFIITRGNEVPEAFWLALRSDWDDGNYDSARRLNVKPKQFRLDLFRLQGLLGQYKVAVEWEETAKSIAQRYAAEITEFENAVKPELNIERLDNLLAESRFRRDLKEFQKRDAARLIEISHGANFSVPGAGKTAVAYAVYESCRVSKRLQRMLIVAPNSAFESWETELTACFTDRPRIARYEGSISPSAEIILVNYQRLLNSSSLHQLQKWASELPTLVLLDEAHRMKKGDGGEWGRACYVLASAAERRDVLTGTPAPQGVGDLVSIMEFLWPGKKEQLSQLAGHPDGVAQVAKKITPFFTRTTKKELNLPLPKLRVESIPLSGMQREIYVALTGRYRSEMAAQKEPSVAWMGKVAMYLLEAASNPSLLLHSRANADIASVPGKLRIDPDSPFAELLKRYEAEETPIKFMRLTQIVGANARQGRKTLVWTNFIKNLERLREVELRQYEPAMVHGGVSLDRNASINRDSEIQRFRNNPNCLVLLANPSTIGEGISLHDVCHDAVYIERTFNAGQYLQSLDRIHRLGLDPNEVTNITFLETEGTIDELVGERTKEKVERLSRLLDDPNLTDAALPNEDSPEEALRAEDIGFLTQHLRESQNFNRASNKDSIDQRVLSELTKTIPDLSNLQRLILGVLMTRGPMTDEQIYDYLSEGNVQITPSGCRGRRSELVEKGLIREAGRSLVSSGRSGIVWAAG